MSRTSHPTMEKRKLRRLKSRGRLFPKGGGADAAHPTTATTSTPTSSPSGPMTRARAKLLQAKVNSLLSLCDFDTPLDVLVLHTHTLCIIRYEEKNPQDEGAPAEETKCSLSPAVLPDLATGTTAWRHYRPMLPPTTEGPRAAQKLSVTGGTTGPGSGTTGPRYYRPCYRHQQKAPAQVPGRQAVLPARKRYYRMTGTTGRAGPIL